MRVQRHPAASAVHVNAQNAQPAPSSKRLDHKDHTSHDAARTDNFANAR